MSTSSLLAHDPVAFFSEEEELARVMREIVEALHGCGAALTLHPTDRPPEAISVDGPELTDAVRRLLDDGLLVADDGPGDQHAWVEGEFENCAPHAMVLPVREVAGHSRLLITVFFETLDATRRAHAEAMYLSRRPFAVGYFRLWQQARLQRRDLGALRAALDLVDLAIMLVTKGGTLAFANKTARTLLQDETGLRERRGRLRAAARADSIMLDVALSHVLDASGDPAALKRVPLLTVAREGRSPLIVSVLPAPDPVMEAGEIGAMVFGVDPDADIVELAAAVCQAFDLTPIETRLACALASGATLAEAAATLHVKEASARGYLKGVFAKTGTNRQVDLVRLILASLVHASDGRAYEPVRRSGVARS